jgi:hypothetical protein
MKFYSATRRRGVAVTIVPATFVALFAVAMAGTSLAQDTSKGVSSWDRLDSVLVLPPVYRPDAAANAESDPTDNCAGNCSSSSDPDTGQLPDAVAGTADNPANASAGTADDPADNPADESAAADGSTSEDSGSQPQAAGPGGDQQSVDSPDPSVGSAQDYQAQTAAQEFGSAGVVQGPSVIIGAPIGPYVPGTLALPTSPAWMPQPMARVVPLPPMVLYGIPRTMPGLAGRGYGGIPGFSHPLAFRSGGRR